MHEVMFGQKKGWYTRIPAHYETFNVTHPVAYVGKSNHGAYHDDGGTGTCCYYEDFRNPGKKKYLNKAEKKSPLLFHCIGVSFCQIYY